MSYCVCPPLQKTENPTLNWAWRVVLLASSDVAILFIEKWLRQWRRERACTFSADCGRIAAVTAADIFGRQICRRHVREHVADMTASCPRTWRRHCLPINASTYFNVTYATLYGRIAADFTGGMTPSVTLALLGTHFVLKPLIWS